MNEGDAIALDNYSLSAVCNQVRDLQRIDEDRIEEEPVVHDSKYCPGANVDGKLLFRRTARER